MPRWVGIVKIVLILAAVGAVTVRVLTPDPASGQQEPADANAVRSAAEDPADANADPSVDPNVLQDPNTIAAPVDTPGGQAPEPAAGRQDSGIAPATVAKMLAKGFAYTMVIAVGSIGIGFLLSIPAGVILNTGGGLVYFIVRSVVDFLRGTPVMVQLFFVFAFLWDSGIPVMPVTAAVLTLSINAMAYMAEVVRSGLMSVDPGQRLAGRALGLSRFQIFRKIVWPQAFRIAIPPLVNSVVALVKDTALVSIIGVAEVVQAAQTLQSITYNPSKYYFIVAVMFFCVTFPLMKLAAMLERRIRERGFAS